MRVLAVVHFSAFGGPHNRTAEVARVLRDQGVETIVALPTEAGSALPRLTAQGLEVHQLPIERIRQTGGFRAKFRTVSNIAPAIREMRGLIRRRNIDVVALNGLGAPHLGYAAHREGAALVWELIDTRPPPLVRAGLMLPVRWWADALMSTGRFVAEKHSGALSFGDRLFYFFPCVDMSRFSPSPEARAGARAELGIGADERVVGTVGNLVPMKGHGTFLRAAAEVKRLRPGTRFLLLGAENAQFSEYWAALLRLAESLELRIGSDLIIRDPGDRVDELAQAIDVFWLTSEHSEGLPTAIGEAMALEIPVVASRVGGIEACISDGTTGYLVAPKDSAALVEPTLRLLDDADLRSRMGAAGRKLAATTYAAEIGAGQHLRAYEAAIAHRAARSSRR